MHYLRFGNIKFTDQLLDYLVRIMINLSDMLSDWGEPWNFANNCSEEACKKDIAGLGKPRPALLINFM